MNDAVIGSHQFDTDVGQLLLVTPFLQIDGAVDFASDGDRKIDAGGVAGTRDETDATQLWFQSGSSRVSVAMARSVC